MSMGEIVYVHFRIQAYNSAIKARKLTDAKVSHHRCTCCWIISLEALF